ncbi:hypothetical protein PFICI_00651 [Pestalotiopsis fici W106-1]|uniref:Chromo domain-containing protein n=1 Tax=Pestalotiopsis fici (strain W106-1 / CGMCC3.15140) TaxID=1229662 RepID=W3XL82_PESFW|nr:uncharacterized protein PFICI_00651 [Pestalotiopsis fici W106-1]ETS86823.1 hypothetical protein PFICI_00651 [Pestalotiopsis fici W106-1]
MNDVSSRVQTAALRLYPIEVVLPSRPPSRHVMTRGLGPALAPLHITPEDDSTARISSKETWSSLTQTGTTKVQLYYIVHWTDLPGASVLVQADKILDYVSPRTVEDFEYKLSLERDAAAERLREELELAKQIAREEEILRHEAAAAGTTPSNPNKTSAKRPGRPSKADILRREAEKAQAGLEVLLPSVGSAASGPSLSTPQKSQKVATDTLDVEDGVEEYDAAEHHHHKVYAANPVAAWNSRSVHSKSSPATRSPRKARSVAIGGFTPAARSSGRWPSKSPRVAEASSPSVLAHSIAKAPRKKGKGKRKGKEAGESRPLPEEPEYVIECIEDQRMFKVKGQEKPHYLVRWEGNWPPDQNPTWEPAENLPAKMVKKFLRKKAQMDIGRYSSVADAFEGDLEEAAGDMDYYSSDENQDADMEEMLLVEEG